MKKLFAILLVAAVIAAVVPANVAHAAKGGIKGAPSEVVTEDSPDRGANNTARPDQDGIGADHGAVDDDKIYDHDNGCGNDRDDPVSPGEDDNNGRCRGLNKQPQQPPEQPQQPPEEPAGGGEESQEVERFDTVRVCFYSSGNAVEVSGASPQDILDFVAHPQAFEATVIAEAWNRVCWDAALGSSWIVLAWNPTAGHAGAVYRVEVTAQATNASLHNPFLYVEVNGVIAERVSSREITGPALD